MSKDLSKIADLAFAEARKDGASFSEAYAYAQAVVNSVIDVRIA